MTQIYVFLLLHNIDYEGDWVLGIYTSGDRAIEAAREYMEDAPISVDLNNPLEIWKVITDRSPETINLTTQLLHMTIDTPYLLP